MTNEESADRTSPIVELKNIRAEYEAALKIVRDNAKVGDLNINDVLWFLEKSRVNEQAKQPDGQRLGVIGWLNSEIDQINGKNIKPEPSPIWQKLIDFELRNLDTTEILRKQLEGPVYTGDTRSSVTSIVDGLEIANMYANARATVQRHKNDLLTAKSKDRI